MDVVSGVLGSVLFKVHDAEPWPPPPRCVQRTPLGDEGLSQGGVATWACLAP